MAAPNVEDDADTQEVKLLGLGRGLGRGLGAGDPGNEVGHWVNVSCLDPDFPQRETEASALGDVPEFSKNGSGGGGKVGVAPEEGVRVETVE